MSADSGLAPAGSSIYSSSTLYVGDGTWDSGRNDFLLPNLVGLNFATMQYNGMGNRFRDLAQYHTLILGHGILAAIVFIFLVPTAIFVAKYGHRNRQQSYKLHVYLQILTVFLSTVILILGWFAVGPERSLTNPHHGIGVAVYTLILFQFLYGWLMSKAERRRKVMPTKIPLKVWLHKLLGRAVAILGFVQIALGLTLYGSPQVLFILYALSGAILLFAYLALDYYYKDRVGGGPPGPRPGGRDDEYYSDYGSYLSGTQMTQDQRRRQGERSHWGRNLLAGAGALGAYEAWKHRRQRRQQERLDGRAETVGGYDTPGRSRPPPGDSVITPVTPSRRPLSRSRRHVGDDQPYGRPPPGALTESGMSPESWEDEKYESPTQRHTWRNRLLGAGAGITAFEGARRLFSRRKGRNDADYGEDYRPPLGGPHNMVEQTDVSRVEAGQAPFSPDDPRRRHNLGTESSVPPASTLLATTMTPTRPSRRPRPSEDYYSESDSFVDSRLGGDRPHTLRDSIAVFGALGGFQNWLSHRRDRREQRRTHNEKVEDIENAEHYNRRTSMNYPRPSDGARPSVSDTVMTGVTHDPALGSNPELSRTHLRPDVNHPPLPAAAGAIPLAAVAAGAASMHGSRHNVTTEEGYVLPPPPPGPPPGASSTALRPPPVPGSAHMPTGAVDPDPSRLLANNTAANESSAYGRTGAVEAGAAGLAAGALLGRATGGHSRDESRTRIQRPIEMPTAAPPQPPAGTFPETANSPPISLKVKMHNDNGGHVTLRRLNEEEVAAEHAARRQDRRQRRRRNSSLSSGVEDEPIGQRYRRNGGVRPSASQPISNVPPPPAMSSAAGSGRRDSELNLPPSAHQSPPVAGPSNPPVVGSGMSGPVGSPGYTTDAGTGTDVSVFNDNRRRRRAERARQKEAGKANRVEFE